MPAKLVVQHGRSDQTAHWIEDEFVRVGSDLTCDICVNDPLMPGHAITLEYTGGLYWMYNRSNRPLRLNGRPVPPNAKEIWPDRAKLEITDKVLIVLLVTESDPSPRKHAWSEGETRSSDGNDTLPPDSREVPREYTTSESSEPSNPQSGSQWIWLISLVAMICIIAAAIHHYLERKQSPPRDSDIPSAEAPGEAEETSRLRFHDTIQRVHPLALADENLIPILATIQDARALELRGRTDAARSSYASALNMLRSRTGLLPDSKNQPGSAAPGAPAAESMLLHIAQNRLNAIHHPPARQP